VYATLLEQFNSVSHRSMLQNVCYARHQLQVGHNKYTHARLWNVLHKKLTHRIN